MKTKKKTNIMLLVLVPLLLCTGCASQSARMGTQSLEDAHQRLLADLNLQNTPPKMSHLKGYSAASPDATYYFRLLNQYLIDPDQLDVEMVDPQVNIEARKLADERFAVFRAETLKSYAVQGFSRHRAIIETKKVEGRKYDPFGLLKELPKGAEAGQVFLPPSMNLLGRKLHVTKTVLLTYPVTSNEEAETIKGEIVSALDTFLSHASGWRKTVNPLLENNRRLLSQMKDNLAMLEQSLLEVGADQSARTQEIRAKREKRIKEEKKIIEAYTRQTRDLEGAGAEVFYTYKWNKTGEFVVDNKPENKEKAVINSVHIRVSGNVGHGVRLEIQKTFSGE